MIDASEECCCTGYNCSLCPSTQLKTFMFAFCFTSFRPNCDVLIEMCVIRLIKYTEGAVAVQSPKKTQNAISTLLMMGWLTRAHLQQCARTQFWMRVYHATAQSHSASQAVAIQVKSSSWMPTHCLPPSRAA